jgi:hypothetical protein
LDDFDNLDDLDDLDEMDDLDNFDDLDDLEGLDVMEDIFPQSRRGAEGGQVAGSDHVLSSPVAIDLES